jgi:hypothetical protein
MIKQIKQSILAFMVFNGLVVSASAQQKTSQENWLNISNTPKCAADMGKPSDSIFISATLRNTGIMLNNLAKQTGQDPATFVGVGLKFYKTKLNILSHQIINGLNTGTLAFITKESEVPAQWAKINDSNTEKQYFQNSSCSQVNEINSYYSHLFLRGINKDTLTQLAEKFSDAKSPLNCDPENIKNDLDLYPVYNYSLNIQDQNKWQKSGFDFWASYKIYLSWAWRNSKNAIITTNPMNKMTLLVPMEEQVLLLSNGCKSIERPECNSDFLSSAELRNLFTTDRAKLELTGSSLEMKDLIMDNNDQTDSRIKENMAKNSGDQTWIKEFQKSYLGFSSKQIENLYTANKLFSSLLTQKNRSQLNSELINEISKPENLEESHYLCTEHRMLTQEQPLNVYKFDLDNLKQNSSKLDKFLKYGMTVSDMLTAHESISQTLTVACQQLDKNQKAEAAQKWNNFRPWYKNFLSRYQIIKAAIEVEKQEEDPSVFVDRRPLTYLKDQCTSAIDCHRKMTESIVYLNKLLIHSRTFLRTEIQSSPIFNERAEKIACGMYDPFEAARLNKKKLVADIASSLLFGWTSLPIYLDINFKPKELVSFNKLMQDGKIKFDAEFDKNQISKTVSLNLGSFLNVPCAINISEVGVDLSETNANYVFKGLGVNACKGNKNESIESPTGSIDVFKKSPQSDFQMCGQCSLNFEKITTTSMLNVYAPLRFVLRLTQSLMRYQNVKNDDVINPREFNISTKSLISTYKKNNNTIPEKCVPMLSRGLSCQSNICEALAVKEFEIKSGLEVENIELGQSRNEGSSLDEYDSAWIRVKGCGEKQLKMTFRCSGNGDSFWMPVNTREYKQCLK